MLLQRKLAVTTVFSHATSTSRYQFNQFELLFVKATSRLRYLQQTRCITIRLIAEGFRLFAHDDEPGGYHIDMPETLNEIYEDKRFFDQKQAFLTKSMQF